MKTSTKTTKLDKKKVISFLITLLVFAVIAILLAGATIFVVGKLITSLDPPFKSAITYYVALAYFVVFCTIYAYVVLKTNMFGMNKTLNRVDRADADTFGNSRWQTKDEMHENYGYYNFDKLPEIETEGYVIKSEMKKGNLMISNVKEQHNLVVGTTGTGKSAYYLGLTIQMNAFSKTKSSLVINDLKGELYSQHSKLLKEQGYNVIKLDLRQPHISDRYNPLSLIWDLYHKYYDEDRSSPDLIDRVAVYINEIASVLCPVGQGDQQQWSKGAQSIIKSVIWGILEDSRIPEFHVTKDMLTILQISNIVNRQKTQLEDFLRHRSAISPVFDYAGMILDNPSEKTVGSYYATLSTALEGFLEEGIQKITSATDIDITKLATEPTALFIIIPDELKTRNIVGTMIISQIYNYLTFEASNNKPTERLAKNVYFLLDEFGNLPIIPNFPSWVALSRGRGIFFNLIIQADSQLEEVYGKNGAKTIMQNCHLQMLLGANEIDTLKRFEDLFGKYTIYNRSANIDQKTTISEYKGSTSLTSKELITLDQLQRIERGTAYFKILRQFPCKTSLVPYFADDVKKHLVIGKVTDDVVTRPTIDKKETYYDLNNRQAIVSEFLKKKNASIVKKANEKKVEQEVEEEKIEEIDENIHCSECGAVIPEIVAEFSDKIYGRLLCRKCQKNANPIKKKGDSGSPKVMEKKEENATEEKKEDPKLQLKEIIVSEEEEKVENGAIKQKNDENLDKLIMEQKANFLKSSKKKATSNELDEGEKYEN